MKSLPCYTQAELLSPEGPHLPGLREPAKLDITDPYSFFRGTDWQPVLNLAIITEDIDATGTTGHQMLTGSRPATESTHPNVVSTPTQWITDRALLQAVLEDHFLPDFFNDTTDVGLPVTPEIHLGHVNPNHYAILGNANPRQTALGRRATPLGLLTQKLLAEKLGFADWYGPENKELLMRGGLLPSIGAVSLSRLLAGFSYVGENHHDEPLYEPIVMLGTVVHTPYPKLFPRTTARYENLSFTDVQSFKNNVINRNVANLIRLDTAADEVMMCVRGLCMSTGAEMSIGPDLIAHGSGFPSGKTYDPDKAARLSRLLAERDAHGEDLAIRTSRILGRQVLAGPRVAFERVPLHVMPHSEERLHSQLSSRKQ